MGYMFAGFGPQNPGEDLGVAHGIIGELVSRQSDFVKVPWPFNAREHNLDHLCPLAKWFK
jgi:hypothetical protein